MDIMQQLMDVDKKAREQERMELIQRFYNEEFLSRQLQMRQICVKRIFLI